MDDARTRLTALRVVTAARADAASAALADLVHDRQGANDDDEHDPEGVTLSSEWSRLSALADAASAELHQVDDALTRMDAGTYGICAGCGRPIPEARLEVRPFAEFCVTCAAARGV